MSWQQIIVETQSEAVEAVSNILMEAGAEGIQIEDAADVANYEAADETVVLDWDQVAHLETGANVSGYFASDKNLVEIMHDIRQKVAGLAVFGLDATPGTVSMATVADADWATEWQKYYHPMRVTRYLTVVPKWETYTPADEREFAIVLDPGLAFGTGTHPTTQLMMQALEMTVRGGERALDVGTGSGVLAIAAKLLGAKSVIATDIDEVAVRSAQGNIDLNPTAAKDIDARVSDLLNDVPEQPIDLLIANMLSEVLMPLMPQMDKFVVPGGKVLMSGIYYDKIGQITTALQEHGYVIDETLRLGDWYGVIAHRQQEEA